MNSAERISRHSRGYKAERPSCDRSRFRLFESIYASRKLITVQLDLMPHKRHRVSIAQRTWSFRVMVRARTFRRKLPPWKLFERVESRSCDCEERVTIAVCFLSSRSIYRPNDPFVPFVDAHLRHDHVFFLFFFLMALIRRITKPMWIWIMILESKRKNTRFNDTIEDSRVWYPLPRGFKRPVSLTFYRPFFALSFLWEVKMPTLAHIIYSCCNREFFHRDSLLIDIPTTCRRKAEI